MNIKIYTDQEEPLESALARLTDEWIDNGWHCDQTVADLRDACSTLLSALTTASEENARLKGEAQRAQYEIDNLECAWDSVVCEEHQQCADLHDQHQKLGGECLFCTAANLSQQLTTALTENATLRADVKEGPMDYTVVIACSVELLGISVRDFIAHGWKPQGGVAVTYNASGYTWAQAMVKKEA